MADLTSKIKQLITTLSNADLSESDKEKFIADLADFIKNEGELSYLNHFPITEKDWGSNKSLFKKFNELIDLDNAQGQSEPTEDNAFSYINHLLDLSGDDAKLWNESLRLMLQLYKDKIANIEGNIITATKKVGETEKKHNFLISDILNANAGWSFVNKWVRPYENIDDKNYDQVRGSDEIQQVLKSHKHMQFTHTQLEANDEDAKNQVQGYIRLIMPKYTRRVEVEDLNRNFWVIGQVLSAISAYLFDDESPIAKMFKYLMSETSQLWENILYIWAALEALSKKDHILYDDDNIHYEVVYVPNDTYNREFKFDGYDLNAPNSLEACKTRVEYIADQYPNKHVCLLPVVRKKNYYRNYYSEEVYYGVLFYDRNDGDWQYEEFNNGQGYTISCMEENDTGNSCLYYIKEDNGKYKYTYNSTSEDATNYIQALRSRVSLFKWNSENERGKKAELEVTIEDAARSVSRIFSSADQRILTAFHHKNGSLIVNNLGRINDTTFWRYSDGAAADAISSASKGLYLCELITNMKGPKINEDEPVIDPKKLDGNFRIVKIGDFYPAAIVDNFPTNFTPITKNKADETDVYDTMTYGLGSYHYNGKYSAFSYNGQLKFINYVKALNGDTTDTATKGIHNSISRTQIELWGKDYIYYLIKNNLPSKISLYITKIGVSYWTGADGSQWNSGIVCDIFVYDPENPKIGKDKISHIAKMNYFDGYWTLNSDVFASKPNNGGKWRELQMSISKIIRKKSGNNWTYSIPADGGGLIKWQDHYYTLGRSYHSQQVNRPQCNFYVDDNSNVVYVNVSNTPATEDMIVLIDDSFFNWNNGRVNMSAYNGTESVDNLYYKWKNNKKISSSLNLNGSNDYGSNYISS